MPRQLRFSALRRARSCFSSRRLWEKSKPVRFDVAVAFSPYLCEDLCVPRRFLAASMRITAEQRRGFRRGKQRNQIRPLMNGSLACHSAYRSVIFDAKSQRTQIEWIKLRGVLREAQLPRDSG